MANVHGHSQDSFQMSFDDNFSLNVINKFQHIVNVSLILNEDLPLCTAGYSSHKHFFTCTSIINFVLNVKNTDPYSFRLKNHESSHAWLGAKAVLVPSCLVTIV